MHLVERHPRVVYAADRQGSPRPEISARLERQGAAVGWSRECGDGASEGIFQMALPDRAMGDASMTPADLDFARQASGTEAMRQAVEQAASLDVAQDSAGGEGVHDDLEAFPNRRVVDATRYVATTGPDP